MKGGDSCQKEMELDRPVTVRQAEGLDPAAVKARAKAKVRQVAADKCAEQARDAEPVKARAREKARAEATGKIRF